MLLAYFTMSNLYILQSERELPGGKRIDILFEGHPNYHRVKYNYVIELKYIKKNKMSEYDKIKQDAITQVKEYGNLFRTHINQLGRGVKCLVILIKHDRNCEIAEVN